MNYLSVCSGIEAASVAWEPLGWKAIGFSEIETFPCSVLAHRFPKVKNYGDLTRFEEWDINETVDLLVGGTPCQSFSIAGLRGGLEDSRGNLALVYCRILQKFQPRWFVWENVPGVLSSNGGRDFGSILGAMVELGYGVAYRVLDAQYFGVPQRRRRVFVVGCLGNWQRAAAVLFEPGCVSGDSQKGKDEKRDVAGTIGARTCRSVGAQDADCGHLIASPLFFDRQSSCEWGTAPRCSTISARDHKSASDLIVCSGVRRLTPRECERLQGFPDDWTLVPHRNKPAADGPRYKAIGNSFAVPVVRWIGERIELSEKGLL